MPQFGRAIIKERAAHLRTACETRKTAWMQSLAGSRQRVLIERDGLSGHAENFAPVRFDNPQVPGEIMQVTIRRSEEHTSELQSLMRISYAVFCLKKKKKKKTQHSHTTHH